MSSNPIVGTCIHIIHAFMYVCSSKSKMEQDHALLLQCRYFVADILAEELRTLSPIAIPSRFVHMPIQDLDPNAATVMHAP